MTFGRYLALIQFTYAPPSDGNAGGGGSENAGGQGGGNAGGSGGSGAGGNAPSFDMVLAGLSPENKDFVIKSGWKGLDDVLKSHRELSKKFSARGTEQQQSSGERKFRRGDYLLPRPANADAISYSDEFANSFLDMVSELDIEPSAATKMQEWFVGRAGGALESAAARQAEALKTRATDAAKALKEKWGNPDSATYKRNLSLAERAAKQLGVYDHLVETGALHNDGKAVHVMDATLYQALAAVGNGMYAEDHLYGETVGNANPFASGTVNLKAQGDIIRNDPDKAEMLIRALPAAEQAPWRHWLNKRATR